MAKCFIIQKQMLRKQLTFELVFTLDQSNMIGSFIWIACIDFWVLDSPKPSHHVKVQCDCEGWLGSEPNWNRQLTDCFLIAFFPKYRSSPVTRFDPFCRYSITTASKLQALDRYKANMIGIRILSKCVSVACKHYAYFSLLGNISQPFHYDSNYNGRNLEVNLYRSQYKILHTSIPRRDQDSTPPVQRRESQIKHHNLPDGSHNEWLITIEWQLPALRARCKACVVVLYSTLPPKQQ